MLRNKSNFWMVILLAVVSFGIACDGQLDEANKLVNEANALITKSNEATNKANALTTELLGNNLAQVEDLEKHKADNKAKFDELIKLNAEAEKGKAEASAKFEQVSKMNVDAKFKEYNSLKAQEMKKAAEIDKADGDFVKAFLAEKDDEKMMGLITDSNKKSADMKKESDDLKAKAEKIVKDNPNIFK
jgi:hypothetical protein